MHLRPLFFQLWCDLHVLLLASHLLPTAYSYDRLGHPRLDNLTETEALCANLYWNYTVTNRVEHPGEQSHSYGDRTKLGYRFMVPLTARLAGITYVGHAARLRLLLERLRLGESIRMGALGGSITFGQGVGGHLYTYGEYFSHWLNRALPSHRVHPKHTQHRHLADPYQSQHQQQEEGPTQQHPTAQQSRAARMGVKKPNQHPHQKQQQYHAATAHMDGGHTSGGSSVTGLEAAASSSGSGSRRGVGGSGGGQQRQGGALHEQNGEGESSGVIARMMLAAAGGAARAAGTGAEVERGVVVGAPVRGVGRLLAEAVAGDVDGGGNSTQTAAGGGRAADGGGRAADGGRATWRHQYFNGAVPGTQSGYMSSCLNHHLPRDVDLVLVEYAVNDPPAPSKDLGDPDRRAFERLIRKLLRLPSRPTVVLVNMFAHLASQGKYWLTAERDFTELATYYGLPSVSLRAAVLPAALSGDPAAPPATCMAVPAIFNGGRYHPGRGGHVVVTELLITLFRDLLHSNTLLYTPTPTTPAPTPLDTSGGDQLHMSLAGHGSDVGYAGRGGDVGGGDVEGVGAGGGGGGGLKPGALAALEAVAFRPLPPPLSDGNYEAAEGTCYIEHELQALIQQPVVGWEWTDEGRGKWGWVTTLPQQQLRIQLNTQLPGNRSAEAASANIVVQLAYLQSYVGMGSVRVACVSGCSCAEVLVDGSDVRTVSVTAMKDIQVSQSPACLLLLTSMGPGPEQQQQHTNNTEQQGDPGGRARGNKFKLLGVVVGEEPGAREGSVSWFRPETHAMSQKLRGGNT